MSSTPITVAPHENVAEARLLMERGNFRRLPVVDGGRLVGMITDRDILRRVGDLNSIEVSAMMTSDPIIVTPEMTVKDAVQLMLSHKFSGLPVVEGGKVVGIITTTDLLKAFLTTENGTQSGS